MPDLTPDQYDALRADIIANGVVSPVILDQHGRILDGNNRVAIATELGIKYPVTMQNVNSDDDVHDRAVTLNCARRHLTREQQREVIRREIARRPDDSDRAIARRVGCSPSTVGSIRRPVAKLSNLDTSFGYDDVDEDDLRIVLDVYGRMNPTPDLPQSDADYEWAQTSILYDADNPLWFNTAIALGAGRAELLASVIGRMALWKARGMDRALIRRLFDSWLQVALSDKACDEIAAEFAEFVESARDDATFLEVALDFTASIPRYPSEVMGREPASD